MRKQESKSEIRLIKNLLNLIRKQKEKLIICYFVEDEKPQKSS